MSRSVALAIFVKTPSLSPVKTRLAASIGAAAAQDFYLQALQAVAAVVRQQDLAQPYWAVAEEQGLVDPLWQEFPKIWQGAGGLGARMARVYSQLLNQHRAVCLIGADSPHLPLMRLRQALALTAESTQFVMGESLDGGFYFIGGSQPIPKVLWEQVSYSEANTAKELENRLRSLASVKKVAVDFDVDTGEDLQKYRAISADSAELLPEQKSLVLWTQKLPEI